MAEKCARNLFAIYHMKMFRRVGLQQYRRFFSPARGAKALVGSVFVTIFAFNLAAGPIHTGGIWVPNHSFEAPRTEFADPRMDGWEKAPEPAWYQGGGGFPWEQLMGQF